MAEFFWFSDSFAVCLALKLDCERCIVRCERLHFGLNLTKRSRFITVHELVGCEGSSLCRLLIFFVRGNGFLPNLSFARGVW
jgi:hypothetical protein